MTNITVLGLKLSDKHIARLKQLGSVSMQESPNSVEDFLMKVENATIIFSNGSFLIEALPKLRNVFVTYSYIELGLFNTEELAKNGVTVANAQGGNRDSIVEWVMYMILELFRSFRHQVRAENNYSVQML